VAQASRATNETRWPAAIAIVGLGGSSLALPDFLVPGPRWLLPIAVVVLLVPALFAHATGRHRLDQVLGYAISVVVTVALAASLGSLVYVMGTHRQAPADLLRSAAVLWVTNVLVFALWYWRLDAGGPHARDRRGGHDSGAFFFPQMMQGAPKQTPAWSPNFVDYLFLAFCTSTAFSPTDTPVLSRWAKLLTMVQSLISLVCIAVLAAHAIGVL
jgi:Protein of unknown function (DUF1345)